MAKSESEKDIRQKNENLNKTVQEQDVAERNQAYNEYVKQVTPTHNLALKMLKAFVTGGIICCIGQVILNIAQNAGLDKDTSGGWCSMILVLMSVILTGLNIYPSIAKFGGAGALVFKKEGQVFGIGCKIFTIAGPVILYGIFTSWLLGVIYWIYQLIAR